MIKMGLQVLKVRWLLSCPISLQIGNTESNEQLSDSNSLLFSDKFLKMHQCLNRVMPLKYSIWKIHCWPVGMEIHHCQPQLIEEPLNYFVVKVTKCGCQQTHFHIVYTCSLILKTHTFGHLFLSIISTRRYSPKECRHLQKLLIHPSTGSFKGHALNAKEPVIKWQETEISIKWNPPDKLLCTYYLQPG